MAKLIPVFLLGVFLTFVIASFSSRLQQHKAKRNISAVTDTVAKTTIVQQYWMVFFKDGSNTRQDPASAALIDEAHILHIRRLVEDGRMILAGAFADYDAMRGMYVLKAADSLEAVSLVKGDTAVLTGRLQFEVKPWWTARNCLFK